MSFSWIFIAPQLLHSVPECTGIDSKILSGTARAAIFPFCNSQDVLNVQGHGVVQSYRLRKLRRLWRKGGAYFPVVVNRIFLNSLYLIILGRALPGISVASIISGFTPLVGDYFKGEKRIQVMGLQAAFSGFGGMIFLTVGGFPADMGWRYPAGLIITGCGFGLLMPNVNV